MDEAEHLIDYCDRDDDEKLTAEEINDEAVATKPTLGWLGSNDYE